MENWLNQLKIDIERLEKFEQQKDVERIEMYKNLIVSHVKELVKENNKA